MPPHMFGFMQQFEFVYTAIIVFFCLAIYFRTAEVYNLTKYKGIRYFRHTFLFFALAYASRFILHTILMGLRTFDFVLSRRIWGPLSWVTVGYLGTMAIFFLAYSTMWKKVKKRHFIVFSNILAIVVSLVAFITHSPIIIALLQVPLLIAAIVMSSKHKFSQMKTLYILISAFWLMNLFVLGQRRFLSLEVKIIFQLLSIIVFILIYYKVSKWTK